MIEYEDVVRSINQAYRQWLVENDGPAREQATELGRAMGFKPEAINTMIDEFSRGPLKEWSAQQSGI
ncbi:MAG: hypothetical protein DI585_04175 [Pseudomonas fluorescens]|nr:MAG: hypothetical protein DI585_04175 [Pseudomonas fluorescens]